MQGAFQRRLQDGGKVDSLTFGHGVQPCGDGQRFLDGFVVIVLPIFQGVASNQRNKFVRVRSDRRHLGSGRVCRAIFEHKTTDERGIRK